VETRVDEIAPDIFRVSTFVPDVPPSGFSFNQFVVRADEPFLFHTGMRGLFPVVSEAVAGVIPLDQLRWIGFAHVEADECGALNAFLEAAPDAQVVHGALACVLSLADMLDRPPVAVDDGAVLDLGGKRMRFVATPHVPHNWESGLWYEETTGTLFAGDLLATHGPGAAVTDADIVGPALATEELFHGTSIGPAVGATLRRLADLEPRMLAIMHGPSFSGDGGAALRAAGTAYDELVTAGS
jgi:flavorubredoxin